MLPLGSHDSWGGLILKKSLALSIASFKQHQHPFAHARHFSLSFPALSPEQTTFGTGGVIGTAPVELYERAIFKVVPPSVVYDTH